MAIWQFRVDAAPVKTICERANGTLPRSITEGMTDHPFWSTIQPPQRFEKWIDAILPRAPSWSEEMEMWGDEEGDYAAVCYKDGKKNKVEDVSFRIDVRKISDGFIRAICALARAWDCVFITAKNEVLQPDESTLQGAIQNSLAKRYLEDPVKALLSLEPSATIPIPPPKEKNSS